MTTEPTPKETKEEKALAYRAAALKQGLEQMHKQIEIDARLYLARLRKAQFDAHITAGFNEMQALMIVTKL